MVRRREPNMACPLCGSETAVIDSRPSNRNTVRRRRKCIACAHTFRTREKIEAELAPEIRQRHLLVDNIYTLSPANFNLAYLLVSALSGHVTIHHRLTDEEPEECPTP